MPLLLFVPFAVLDKTRRNGSRTGHVHTTVGVATINESLARLTGLGGYLHDQFHDSTTR